MFSILDTQLFPDECIVLDTGHELVFPIFKNGSSSLLRKYKIASDLQIQQSKEITVFIREPLQRFYTGVDTFIKNNPELDSPTLINLINKHLFLDRHFCPQFFWILNLQRYTKAKLKILDISELSSYTDLYYNISSSTNDIRLSFKENDKLHFYMSLDKALYKLLNQTKTFADILKNIKQEYPDVYTEVIERSKKLCSVLD